MSNPVSYVEVMRYLAEYASNNLNLQEWMEEDKRKILTDITTQNEDAFDKMAPLRTKKDLGGDELDAIEIVLELEDEFDVQISDEWVGSHEDDPTMGELAELIVALTK